MHACSFYQLTQKDKPSRSNDGGGGEGAEKGGTGARRGKLSREATGNGADDNSFSAPLPLSFDLC